MNRVGRARSVEAIQIVERALERCGAPVYVRHEIVAQPPRGRAGCADMGAVFVADLHQCPSDRPVIFSAHGVPKSVPAEAERRGLFYLDATCPWSPRSTSTPNATTRPGRRDRA